MIYIEHRRNRICELENVNPAHGVEVDLRSVVGSAGQLHTAHDPWQIGEDADKWFKAFEALGIHGPLVLNTKEDGLEQKIIEITESLGLENILFLDTSMPTLVKHRARAHQFFLRLSQYEPLEGALLFKDRVRWLWVDCFHAQPLPLHIVEQAKHYFKLCLVSPELQGAVIEDIVHFREIAVECDAICTKSPAAWQELLPK
jgi:hypothetical protein